MDKKELSFEEAYATLEAISQKLSDEGLPLDEAIKLYEEGMKLSAFCSKTLEQAKLKIETLGKED